MSLNKVERSIKIAQINIVAAKKALDAALEGCTKEFTAPEDELFLLSMQEKLCVLEDLEKELKDTFDTIYNINKEKHLG
jgi:hypothetical protein